MKLPLKIYNLSGLPSDPRYEGFRSPAGHFLETIPRQRASRDWKVMRVAKEWAPQRLNGRVTPFNDYPCVDLIFPAFSIRAVTALRDFLGPNGELLPVTSTDGTEYYAYNVTTVADILDRRRSQLQYLSDGITALGHIRRYEFNESGVRGLSIFRIPEQPHNVFVAQPFVSRAAENDLKGFDFQLVWPLPEGADWLALVKSQRQIRKGHGGP